MAVEPGHRLLHYRLVEQIGEGGMGVVWKAIDTTLDRVAAIKLLPQAFAADAGRLVRLEREAKALAALNHPNIAAVYGFHEVDGVRFIAMELVEGETLADRLGRDTSGLTTPDTLEIGRQIAEALEAAHERGIIHRDLKPANVKLRPDGTVKVLDFGLARATEPACSSTGGAAEGLTMTAEHTTPGTVLGTVPYMSPEQARGMPVDKRTDIWSLGCVLYECLTGRRPFDGPTSADVLAKIVSQQPDLSSIPGRAPAVFVLLVRRCLEKDPKSRLRDAGEVRVALEQFRSNPDAVPFGGSIPAPRPNRFARLLPWAMVVLFGVAWAYSLMGPASRPGSGERPVSRWSIPLPPGTRVGHASLGARYHYSRLVAVSPDGSRIAFAVQDLEQGRVDLYMRELDERGTSRIPGTGTDARAPFFSPDGRWLGFWAKRTLQKVALTGGAPQKICDVQSVGFDATWSPGGESIVFATDDGLWRVAAVGGKVDQLTVPRVEDGEVGHHFPQFTADGRGVLFTITSTPETHLALLSLETGTWKVILKNAAQGRPVGGDRLAFVRSGELLVAPYDRDAQRITGAAIPVVQGLHTSPGLGGVVVAHFDLADTGTLVYVPAAGRERIDQLVWVDHSGNETPITSGPGTWVHPKSSPDGKRVSVDIHSANGMRDVYIYELERAQLNRLTREGITWESAWRPDGDRIALMSGHPAGQWSLFWAPTDFSEQPELLHVAGQAIPASWSPDGRSLVYYDHSEAGIFVLSPDGDRTRRQVAASGSNARFPALSADGNWMAYVADESGRREVFVQSFPDLGPRYKVSIDGGGEPVWSRDGRQLFFREGDQMFAVDIVYRPSFRAGAPRVLFDGRYDDAPNGHQHYDISADGERFLMVNHDEPSGPSEVRVVLNWSEELQIVAPLRGSP